MIKNITKYTISYSLTIFGIVALIGSFVWHPETAPFIGKLDDMNLFMVMLFYLVSGILVCCGIALVIWCGTVVFIIGNIVHKFIWRTP